MTRPTRLRLTSKGASRRDEHFGRTTFHVRPTVRVPVRVVSDFGTERDLSRSNFPAFFVFRL